MGYFIYLGGIFLGAIGVIFFAHLGLKCNESSKSYIKQSKDESLIAYVERDAGGYGLKKCFEDDARNFKLKSIGYWILSIISIVIASVCFWNLLIIS